MKTTIKSILIASFALFAATQGASAQRVTRGQAEEIARLAVKAPQLLASLREKKEIAVACYITRKYVGEERYFNNESDAANKEFDLITMTKDCCLVYAAGNAARVGGFIWGRLESMGKGGPKTSEGRALANKIISEVRRGALAPIRNRVEAIADQADAAVIQQCLPTIAFSNIVIEAKERLRRR